MQRELENQLERLGFPLDAIGQIDVTLVDAGQVKGRGGPKFDS